MLKHKQYLFLAVTTLLSFISASSQAQFQWAKSMGSTFEDSGRTIKVDNAGNVYTSGYFQGTVDFDPGAGMVNLSSNGNYDIFISKLDANGNLIWAKQVGGSFLDESKSMVLDQNGNVYICGIFFGTVDFDPGVATFNLNSAGFSHDIFILKLDSSGNFLWAKSMGGTGTDEGLSLALDGGNHAYITGYFTGTADFDPGSDTFNLTAIGVSHDVFICKLNESGQFIWAKQMGGNGTDDATSIAVDDNATIFATGFFEGAIDLDPNAGIATVTAFANADVFVVRLDSSGNYIHGFNIGGFGFDYCKGITVDSASNIYVCGFFDVAADFDPSAAGFLLTSTGGNDVFVAKYQVNGSLVWARNMGGLIDERAYSIALDESGNIYTCGSFTGAADFDPGAGNYILQSAGSTDIFVSKLDNNGNFLKAINMGGSNGDAAFSITIDPLYTIYTTGDFQGTADFDPEFGTYNLTATGFYDIFISKLGGNLTSVEYVHSAANEITIYPNPNTGTFNLIISEFDYGSYTFRIYNSTGQLVHQFQGIEPNTYFRNLNLEPGLYFYSLERESNNAVSTGKVLIQ